MTERPMDTQIDDDEELIFDDAAPDQATEATPEEKAESAASEEPAPTAAAPGQRSRTGMAVAAGFALCIIASAVSAIQSWRVTPTAQPIDTTALAARPANIQIGSASRRERAWRCVYNTVVF